MLFDGNKQTAQNIKVTYIWFQQMLVCFTWRRIKELEASERYPPKIDGFT